MTLAEQLQDALKQAMRAHDDPRRDTLRMALSALYSAEKTERRPLTEDEALAVLAHEVKVHRESIEAFDRGGRPDLVAKEEADIAVLSEFLPEALGDAEVDELIGAAIEESGAASPKDLGKVMKLLAPRVRGRADVRAVSERVQRLLTRAAGATAAPSVAAKP